MLVTPKHIFWGTVDYLALGFVVAVATFVGSGVVHLKSQLEPTNLTYMGMLPIESLPVKKVEPAAPTMLQDTLQFKTGKWADNNQMLVAATQIGQKFAVEIPTPQNASVQLVAYLTKSYDYGIVQFYVNGGQLGPPIDLWSEWVVPTGAVTIGTFSSAQSTSTVEIRVVGKNKASAEPFYQFGVDGLKLMRVDQ